MSTERQGALPRQAHHWYVRTTLGPDLDRWTTKIGGTGPWEINMGEWTGLDRNNPRDRNLGLVRCA